MLNTLCMERAFTKDQILALYLNEIYLGMGSYGVAAAALNYFDKSLDQLTLEEMAYLAALPKAPANYHPIRKTRAATIRRDWVLSEMQQNGFITGDEARRARTMPLQIARQSGFDSAEAPYFAEEVRREVKEIKKTLTRQVDVEVIVPKQVIVHGAWTRFQPGFRPARALCCF